MELASKMMGEAAKGGEDVKSVKIKIKYGKGGKKRAKALEKARKAHSVPEHKY